MARVSLSWVLILGLLTGIGPLCTDLYLPALPEMSEQLATTTTLTQLTLTSSLIGLGLGQLLFGPLSDRIGRKVPVAVAVYCLFGTVRDNSGYSLADRLAFCAGRSGGRWFGALALYCAGQISGRDPDPVLRAAHDGERHRPGAFSGSGRLHCHRV